MDGLTVAIIVIVAIVVILSTQKRNPPKSPSLKPPINQDTHKVEFAHKYTTALPVDKSPVNRNSSRVIPRKELGSGVVLNLLQQGYQQRACMKIKYETGNPVSGEPAIKIREVDVYSIGSEYFDAYCHYRQEKRTFRISRVLAVTLTDRIYTIPRGYVPSGWVTDGYEDSQFWR